MAENTLSKLLIYRNILKDENVNKYEKLFNHYHNSSNISNENFENLYYDLCSSLLISGYDSINDYLSYMIMTDENIFSLKAENKELIDDKIKNAVLHDISLLKKIFSLPLNKLAEDAKDKNNFINYGLQNSLAQQLQEKAEYEVYNYLLNEYSLSGCGAFRNNFAFGLDDKGKLIPIENFNPIQMDNIYGYESQKKKIIKNTEKFLQNQFALNALLVGDSGTGKSTTVKALIPLFKERKLRLIEVDKKNLHYISETVEMLKNRGMYFIVFIDDLSFESNENSYKHLKSTVEGSIYEQPRNVLFYVTSNRKHLIKESMVDRQNEIHIRDAINEQTSLSDRFGLTILYSEPNQNEYYEIVLGLAKKYKINYESEEQLYADAKKYAMQNGGRTGRTAVQFVKTYR